MESANSRRTVADIRRVPGCNFRDLSGTRNDGVVQRVLTRLLLLAIVVAPITGGTEELSSQNLKAAMPLCGPQSDGQVYCNLGSYTKRQLTGQNLLDRRNRLALEG